MGRIKVEIKEFGKLYLLTVKKNDEYVLMFPNMSESDIVGILAEFRDYDVLDYLMGFRSEGMVVSDLVSELNYKYKGLSPIDFAECVAGWAQCENVSPKHFLNEETQQALSVAWSIDQDCLIYPRR